jgi:methionyl-tRNA synthetase
VPIPWDEKQVTYVWVDALINYLSALTYARDGEDLRDAFWPHAHHVLGKDILRFHCVFWPALLLSAGYEVPQQLFVHGWLLGLDKRKLSKSAANTVDPFELADIYGADAVRFWALRAVSFGQDGNASLDGLHERYERELANDLGNLVSRTTAMIARYREGRIAPSQPNDELKGLLDALRAKLVERFDAWELTAAIEDVWELVRWLNRHVEATAPWGLAKDEANAEQLDAVLYDLADGIRAVAVALSPYLPETAPRILGALRQPIDLSLEQVAYGKTDVTEGIEPAAPLFPRVDLPTAAA